MRKNPERTAWAVLLTAFVACCVLGVGAALWVRWFVLESTVSLVVDLSVSRNTVGVTAAGRAEETERDTRILAERATLTTDSTSQALLTFRDPYSNRVLATFTLLQDSVITFQSSGRPRFEASAMPYSVEIIGARGRADVIIPLDLDRRLRFRIFGAYDTVIELEQSGRYWVTLGGDHAGVAVRQGQAVLGLRASETVAVVVPAGERGIVPGPDPEEPISLVPARRDLLVNSSFDLYDLTSEGLPALPSSWGCYNTQDVLDEPHGNAFRDVFDGRSVLRIQRTGDNLSHAETGCRQPLAGLDVSNASYLEVRAVFSIVAQSISTCGILGSECPVMLRIVYVDKNGENREWIHGFYSLYTVPDWPRTCVSCRQDHERINPGTWYTYESGNLVNTLPEEAKIHALVEVRFYTSGHAYDVMLDEVSLLASP